MMDDNTPVFQPPLNEKSASWIPINGFVV
jgi:hypothetical protein